MRFEPRASNLTGAPSFAGAAATGLYLVRHGETAATRELRYEGRGDGDLTPAGILQAERAAEILTGRGITALYSSPRLRAARTARIIGDRLGLVPIKAGALAEVDFGRWEGLTFREIRRRDPENLEKWLADPLRARPPGGENLEEMWERVRGFLEGAGALPGKACQVEPLATPSLASPKPSPSPSPFSSPSLSPLPSLPAVGPRAVAIVSHGGPIRALLSFCKSGDLRAFMEVAVSPGEIKVLCSSAEST